jgi:hypothetical protein
LVVPAAGQGEAGVPGPPAWPAAAPPSSFRVVAPVPVLLEAAPLPVRYQLLRDILEVAESEDFKALRKNLRKHQPRRKLLAAQDANGIWSPGSQSQKGLQTGQRAVLQLIHQLEVLHELAVLQTTGRQEKALAGMQELIRMLDTDQSQVLRLHHYLQAIHLALHYEVFDNPVIKQLVWDILKRQQADGGWASLPGESSDYWTSLYLVRILGTAPRFEKNRSLRKGLKYLVQHVLEGGQSSLLPGMQAWDTLITGTRGLAVLGGGSLRLLETLQLYEDESVDRLQDKLVRWLRDIQLKNGLWPAIVGRDKQGDYQVTLRVLKALKHFYTRRLALTAAYEEESQ